MITVNGTPLEFDGSVADLVATGTAGGIAVAVNGEVVRRSHWEEHLLTPGDRVEIVTAVQGG